MTKKQPYYFDDDGITPNSQWPVVILPQIYKGEDLESIFPDTFKKNNWSNNWLDIIQSKDHYHSTTHEVLGICKGEVSLKIGGAGGEIFYLKAGDAIIIPAGVGHFSIDHSSEYLVAGGYPEGKDWDMIYNEIEKYETAKQRISLLPIPKLHPLSGESFTEFIKRM